MQQPNLPTNEPIAIVHMARSLTEAMVVRGLLESAGITSPELGGGSSSPWPGTVSILHPARGIEIPIYAIQSRASQARELIAEYLAEVGQRNEQGEEWSNSAADIDDGGENS